jgi:hypothetical protein
VRYLFYIRLALKRFFLFCYKYKDIQLQDIYFEVRRPRFMSNKSKCNVYAICRKTQFSTRWYANLLNINLNV